MKPISAVSAVSAVSAAVALASSFAAAPAAAQAAAYACTPIESLPATITSPGVYCLVDSHTTSMLTGNLVTIAASDVTLDCQGNTMRNTGTASNTQSVAVHASKRVNTVVRNCRIIGGFRTGIQLVMPLPGPNASYYNTVEDNYIAGTWSWGIRVVGSANRVRRNEIYDVGGHSSGGGVGIQVSGSPTTVNKFHIVEGNTIAGTGSATGDAHAILADYSIASVFDDNLISGVFAPSDAFAYGIRVIAGIAPTFRRNHVNGGPNGNVYGISNDDGGTSPCFHNTVRTSLAPFTGCDTSDGNY